MTLKINFAPINNRQLPQLNVLDRLHVIGTARHYKVLTLLKENWTAVKVVLVELF